MDLQIVYGHQDTGGEFRRSRGGGGDGGTGINIEVKISIIKISRHRALDPILLNRISIDIWMRKLNVNRSFHNSHRIAFQENLINLTGHIRLDRDSDFTLPPHLDSLHYIVSKLRV